MSNTDQRITIIGAGLAGSLLAIFLAKRGMQVNVFEARGDMRREEVAAGRSINLALSDRGIASLREVGMDEYMLSEAVPMYGRMIHSLYGETKLLPYSGRQGEYINSVSRAGLNIALIDKAEKNHGVQFIFNERCTNFDFKIGEAEFESGRTIRADAFIATDGAGSAVRQAMTSIDGFEFNERWLEHGYKELHIPSAGGQFAIEKNALHIWPRHKFMMIALPNFDGSFTCTLFIAHESKKRGAGLGEVHDVRQVKRVSSFDKPDEPAFDHLTDANALLELFNHEFSDAVPLMPTLVEDFFRNPTGNLGTVKCWPWHVGGKALLLGDSAHAVVPFYGQGMNCAFEDVRVLDSLIEKHGPNWDTVFADYAKARKTNTDAIADMAEENFYEMRDSTADPVFQRKRDLETKLEQKYADYYSKYSMVTFREDMPYAVAKELGNAQDKILMEICAAIDDVKNLDLDLVMQRIRSL